MFDDRTSERFGAIAIVLTVAAMVLVLTVDCGGLRPSVAVTAYFAHPGALREGADVIVGGQVIGRIEAIELVPPDGASSPDHPLHPRGGAAVHLRIERRRASWASPTGEFFVASRGVLGEAYLAIGPPAPGSAPSRPLTDGDTARGIDPVRLEQVLTRSFQNTAAFARLLDDMAPEATRLRDALGRLEVSLAQASPAPAALSDLGAALGDTRREAERLVELCRQGDGSAARFAATMTAVAVTARRMRAGLSRVTLAQERLVADLDRVRQRIPADAGSRLDGTMEGAHRAAATAASIGADGRSMAGDLADGRGTIGALLRDPEFIDDAKKLGRILKRQPWRIVGRDPDRPAEN